MRASDSNGYQPNRLPGAAGLVVLRQEVAVLRRQDREPGLGWADRMVIAALIRLLRRPLGMSRLVTAGALLRWS